MYYQNYHKHTSLSHRYNKDSSLVPMDYINIMKPLAEQGIPQIYSTLEHGWQSNYFHIYNDLEAFNNKNKDNPNYKPIKFIFGTEAYWVEDRLSKDGSNNHIVLLAKNDNGRKKLNRAIYESFKTGYYYKGRMDLDILLNLPKDDIFCTSACIAFWLKYAENGWNKIDDIVLKLNDHFTDFYLEVQANNTDKQKKVNEHILDLHYKYNIPIIGATDSHEISLDQMDDRDYLLKSNHITYEDEDGNYMDFPSYDVLVERFKNQNILNDAEITECLENTNKILDFEDIVLDRSLKVPVAKQYRGLTQEERNDVLKTIITKEWQLQKGDINKDKLAEYKKQNRHDLNEILACNMADYFIDSYLIMKRGQELGGILTDSGRGSSVSFFLNKLLRLTKVDKVNAPVTMYSERFLTATRILESKVPPDVDNNVNAREPFIEAQKEIVGEEGTFDLLAIGTLKYKSAFKMYARAHDLDVETQNIISKQIDQYETALKYAKEEFDDDEIDISIYDYVDEKYRELIDGCQQYRGIVDTLKSHPCFTKDALVMTDKGYKAISDIQIGDNVLTVDNNYHKVTRLMNHEATDIYALNLQGSENFEVTSNHPFFTAKRKNISSHIHGESRRELTSYQWKEVKDLTKGDLIGVAINQKSVLPQLDFVDTTNKNFWWTLGRYFGDGWRSHTVRRSGKRVGEKIKDVVICCNKNNNETNEIINKLNWCSYRITKENTTNKIYIHCQGLYEWLEQFGDYAKGKHFTNIIYDLPIDYLREFLNGYLSADGHIDSNRNCHVLTTINKELAYGVIACVHKAYHTPCRLAISKTNGKEIICGRIVNTHPRYRISFKFYSAPQDRAFYKDKYMWYPFVGKELLNKTETVYNLEVEENHTYTVYNYIVHNCGTLCYSGNAIEDVGVIMVKSESTGRECFVALQESATIDSFGFLKQDYLVVDTVSLISDIYKEIGMKSFTINELLKEIDGDKLTWDIYSQGRTMCINQVEQEKSTQKVMRYKPQNISELCSFIAGIRPSFKSMYNIFESRRHFDYGVKAFDNLLQDEYRSSSFIFYQEDLMKVLGFAGFPMKDTYTIIKAISKKKKHVIEDAKVKFIPNFTQAILDTKETQDRQVAEQMANKVWTIIENSASYGFNASHSFCMAIDSVTLAWQKAHYPLEFYKVALQRYTDKGEKNKVIRIKKEMQRSGITLNDIAFGQDNRKFSIDKTTNSINQTMASIKDTQKTAPQELYELQKNHYNNFLELLQAIDKTSINSKTLTILICLNYFSEFGNPNQLLEIVKLYNKFGSVKVLTKSKLTPQELEIASKYAHKATEKQLREIDTNGLLNELIGAIKASTDPLQQICYDVTYLGYTNRTYDAPYYAVTGLETNNYGTTYISLYNIQNGSNESYKLSRKWENKCEQGDILRVAFENKVKYIKNDNGQWVPNPNGETELRIKLFNVVYNSADFFR